MTQLLKEEDLKNRKFFHKPLGADGRVLPHASFVKEFVDFADFTFAKKMPVRLASNLIKGE